MHSSVGVSIISADFGELSRTELTADDETKCSFAPREDQNSGAHNGDRIDAPLRTLRRSARERLLLLKDRRHLFCHLRVELNEALPLLGYIPFGEDRLHGAFDSARIAIDAIVRVDIQHLITFVKALARANH